MFTGLPFHDRISRHKTIKYALMNTKFIMSARHQLKMAKVSIRAGSNYTKLYQLQLHKFFSSITVIIFQLQLHCFHFNYNYIMRNQIYSAFVNYVFLRVLLNFNILYTIDKQI